MNMMRQPRFQKSTPLAKDYADKYLVELDKKQCEKEVKVLRPDKTEPVDNLKDLKKHKVQEDEQPVPGIAKMPDLTKLINLYKVAVEYLREINAKSRKPVLISYYQFTFAAVNEVCAITLEVERMNLTEDEEIKLKEELNNQVCEKVKPYRDTIVSLKMQIEAKGYGHIGDTSYFDHPELFLNLINLRVV